MSDLISRQDVLDAVNDCGICIQRILDIPSAEPERKWIPVSEALPEEKQNVLITTIDGERKVSMLTDFTYWWNIGRGKVLAWMPLPEPWRGEE